MTKQEELRGKKATFDKTVKNKTMEELVFKDIAKDSPLKTTESGIIVEKDIPLIDVDTTSKTGKQRQIENWINYNKEVLVLDKKYSENIELVSGDILVRLFKKPIIDKYGFEKQNNLQVQLRNGAFKTMRDELAFNFTGIIVNVDKVLEGRFPKNTIVQVTPEVVMTKVYAEAFQYLTYGFIRDEDEDEKFSNLGYILIKQNAIQSKILDFDIEKYTAIKEISIIK